MDITTVDEGLTAMQTCSNSNNQVGYELFLPAIASTTRIKEVKDEQLSDSEFRSVVATVFRDSVIQLMRDTGGYMMDVPIDIYDGVEYYNIVAPEGFMVESLVDVLPNKCDPKNFVSSSSGIMLDECPTKDISQAFYARVSVIPKHNTCFFDEGFVDRYYEIILTMMLSKLLAMPTREWKSLEQSRMYFQSYYRDVAKERYKLVMELLMSNDRKSTYGRLLFEFATSLYRVDGNDDAARLLNPIEFKTILENAYQNAVRKVMTDTRLYQVDVPIDLYEGVKHYDIIPPKGFYVVDVGEFKEHKVKIPSHTNTMTTIELNCCPKKDISEAFYVEVALAPESGHTNFDEGFIKQHSDLIKTAMRINMYGMKERYWYDPGMMGMYMKEYDSEVQTARRRVVSGGSTIKLKIRRMSSYA